MPAKDRYHDTVKAALVKDGWTITDDPLRLVWGNKDLYVDLGAERVLAAEKGSCKIAVESKSFLGPSDVHELQVALGQYVLYHDVLSVTQPDRALFLAIHEEIWEDVFEEPIGTILLDKQRLRLLVFDERKAVIVKWVPQTPTGS